MSHWLAPHKLLGVRPLRWQQKNLFLELLISLSVAALLGILVVWRSACLRGSRIALASSFVFAIAVELKKKKSN